jgi:hypothetical protein
MKRHSFVSSLGIFLGAICVAAAADAPEFQLDIAATSGEPEIQLPVPANGKVDFSLIQPKLPDPPATIDLSVSPFVGEQGDSLTANLTVPGVSEAKPEHRGISAAKPVMHLQLSVPSLPTAGKYRGSLILTANGKDLKIWRLVLSRSAIHQPGTLVVDPHLVPLEINRPLWGGYRYQSQECNVQIWEKTGQWDLHGVTARLEEVAKAPGRGFDLKRNVEFKFNGQPAPDFTGPTGSSPGWTVLAGQPATVTMAFRHLDAGEYNATIRFTAADSTLDDAQKLTLVLHVRDSIWRAVFVLVFALCLSFAGTKFIGFQRNRYALLKRINDLKRDWLGNVPATLPVVWVRSVLRQSEDLSGRYLLSGLDVIEARVNRAAVLIDLLDRVRKLREGIRALTPPIAFRARVAIDRIVNQIEPMIVDDATAAQIKAKLAELEGWLDPAKSENLYSKDVQQAIDSLKLNVVITDIPNAQRHVMGKLIDLINSAVPADLKGKIAREGDYARLKILWEHRRSMHDFEQLIELQNNAKPLDDFFELADQLAWKRVKHACDQQLARIIAPQSNGPDPLQAFHPLGFRVTTGDEHLDQTYLFSRGLKYTWTCSRRFRGGSGSSVIETDVPQMVEYAEGPGELSVEVEICRGHDSGKVVGPKLTIDKSTDFRWQESLERVELLSFGLAFVVAIVSGLAAIYVKNASFGSLLDYLSLFLWGAGVDQGKNALQVLQSYSNSPTKSP